MVDEYSAGQRRRGNSGSTAIELNLYPYAPNPRHGGHAPYPTDDQESVKTAVVTSPVDDEENLLYGKDSGKGTEGYATPRGGLRTPSPTPSELKELQSGAINWEAMRSWRFWIRREWLWYYVAIVLITVITVLVSVYHKQIVHWLTPAAEWLKETTGGWLVPIAVLFVISFPPLFGHEIVAILCGLVWGFWIGFGIVSAGTLAGEIGNFYAFKYCCRSRGGKLERTNISYACLARVVRDGGFKIALIVRLSAIPGHFTTAVFSTCGMGIIVFTIAAILSMPKQILGVYLGVLLKDSESGNSDKKGKLISNIVLAVTFIITVVSLWYILRQMNKVKPEVIYKRRKARQAKLALEPTPSGTGPYLSTPTRDHRPTASESTLVVDDPFRGYKGGDQISKASTHEHPQHQPRYPPLEAPQPRRPVSIDRRAFMLPASHEATRESTPKNPFSDPQAVSGSPYGVGQRGRNESTEEVGWDMSGGRSGAGLYQYRSSPFGDEGGLR